MKPPAPQTSARLIFRSAIFCSPFFVSVKRAGTASVRAERTRERLADEYTLPRRRDALPVRLEQRLSRQIVSQHDGRRRKLVRDGARLRNRPVAAGRPRFEPTQAAHLARVGEPPAARRQVIRDGAWQETIAVER